MTPDVAAAAVDALGDAFAVGDADLVLAACADADDIVYAGSELGEGAVGETLENHSDWRHGVTA